MPVFKPQRDPSGGYPFLSEELLALMMFPDDATEREAACATLMLAKIADGQAGQVTVDAGLLRQALAGPGLDGVRKRMAERQIKGYVAGEVLRGLRAQVARGERPNVTACVQELEQELARYETFGGKAKGYGDRSIRSAWASHKAVAHYWAAQRIYLERAGSSLRAAGHPDWFAEAVAAPSALHLANTAPAALVAGALAVLDRVRSLELLDDAGSRPLFASGEAWEPAEDFPIPTSRAGKG